ncbi:MFS transporter [Thermomonospora catenispora]|uniref:MFS transporter n=1 Tax=Thermomonospora catenispora TaxID=2493090 RepID=UPI001122DBBB|nr:MFS transporter [Thermomonospora catenispora]TNY36121.1 hypothetical protein EIO00_14655 [Thermomonospora catenispora]
MTRSPTASRSPHVVSMLLFLNAFGGFLTLVALSARIGAVTGSGLLAGAVLSAPWLPALLLAGPLNRLLHRRSPDRLVQRAEATSLALTAAALLAPGGALLTAAAVLMPVRGYFEAITRSAASVVLRHVVAPERLDRANTAAEIGKLTGLSAGAALAGPGAEVLSLRGLIAVNAATLALTALLARALPPVPPAAEEGAAAADARLRVTDPLLRLLFARFLLVAFWQGFHTVAVTVIPLRLLEGGPRLVGAFVAVSSVAIFAGSLVALPVQRHLGRLPSSTWVLVPMPPLLAAVLVARTAPTLALYAIFLMLFEVAYVYHNNRLLAAASVEELPSVVTLRATLLPLGVTVSILALGALNDLAGPQAAAFAVVAVTVLVTAAAGGEAAPGRLLGGTRPAGEGAPRKVPAAGRGQAPT